LEDYTGLAAVAWELFSGEEPGADFPFFRGRVASDGTAALDVGCGTGRLLMPMLREGLDVEGVDPSEDMLAICRRRAASRGVAPVLYRQAMEALELPRRYRTIFIPCGTFQLLDERAAAWEALRRLHAHLEPGGLLLLTLFNHDQETGEQVHGEWRLRARAPLPDGSELEKQARIEWVNPVDQSLAVTVRYRRFRGEEILEEQICPTRERWYLRDEMTRMLERAGFTVERVTGNYTDAPFVDAHTVMTLHARRR
jgi:SAM-dependent methyltransferase